MLYSEARNLIKKGDLIAFTHTEWGTFSDWEAQAIRFVDQTEYAHVALAYPMEGRVYVMEAVKPLTRIFPLSKLGNFFWMPVDIPMSPEASRFAHAHMGESYGNGEAIKGKFGRTDPDNDIWQCAEFWRLVRMIDGFPDGKNTPSQLIRDAQNLGKALITVRNELLSCPE